MSKPRPASTEPRRATREAIEAAGRALREERPAAAERLARESLRSNPGDALAAQALGHALLSQGRAAEAVDPLQEATRRSDDPALETLLARVLFAVGRTQEAVDLLRRTTARRPPFTLAFVELGDQLAALERFEDGIAAFEKGLKLSPDAAVLRMGLGYLHLKRDDRAEARSQFLQVRAASPQRRDAIVALAKVMLLDGDYAEAAGLYRRALELRPADPVTRIELGKCLLELGERKAGEAVLRDASRGGPQAAELAIRALCQASHGRFFLRRSAAMKFLARAEEDVR